MPEPTPDDLGKLLPGVQVRDETDTYTIIGARWSLNESPVIKLQENAYDANNNRLPQSCWLWEALARDIVPDANGDLVLATDVLPPDVL
jgi:hypothetical protein